MRENLYRGKRVDDGEWVEGWFLMYPFSRWPLKAAIIPAEQAHGGYHTIEEVIPETVGQYTGLTDKNGKKIFEGDVVKSTDNFNTSVVYFVEHRNGALVLHQKGVFHYVHFNELPKKFYQIEVIGNIHDNPELLRGGT